jgi:hypothetical protein
LGQGEGHPKILSVAKVALDLSSYSNLSPLVPADDVVDGIDQCGYTLHLVGKLCPLANELHFGAACAKR